MFYMKKFDKTIFAQRLKEARKQANLTQNELAEKVGLSTAIVSSYENPNAKQGNNPTIGNIFLIADILNVSIDWLCDTEREQKFYTYTDIIKMLVSLDETIGICPQKIELEKYFGTQEMNDLVKFYKYDIEYERMAWNTEQLGEFSFSVYALSIKDRDNKIYKFISDWWQLRTLYYNGTINEDIYRTWLAQKYTEFNIKIGYREEDDWIKELDGEKNGDR